MKYADRARLLTIAVINILLSLLFYWKVAIQFGATTQSDIFFYSIMIPNFIISLFGGSLVSVTVPILISDAKGSEKEVVAGLLMLLGGSVALIASMLAITSSAWIGWLAPGFGPKEQDLVISVIPLQFLTGVLSVCISIYTAYYYSKGGYIFFEVLSAIGNTLSLFLVYLLSEPLQVAGLVIAYSAKYLFLLFSLRTFSGFSLGWHVDLKTPIKVMMRIRPLVLSSAVFKSEEPIEKVMLSTAPRGELTIYHLAVQVLQIVQTIYSRVIINPLLTRFSISIDRHAWTDYRRTLVSSLLTIMALNVLGIGLLLLVGEPILQFVLPHDRFASSDVTQLWWIMLCLAGYLVGGSIGQVSVSGFYAMGDTITPSVIGIVGFIFGIVLKIVFFLNYGIVGLAVATSLYYVINSTISLAFLLYRVNRTVARGA
jgi:peptidoglycan biosynthesis protein MviN/MurJ (putative lipid II flippase)